MEASSFSPHWYISAALAHASSKTTELLLNNEVHNRRVNTLRGAFAESVKSRVHFILVFFVHLLNFSQYGKWNKSRVVILLIIRV